MATTERHVLKSASKAFDMLILVGSFTLATLPHLARGGPVVFTHFLEMRIKLQNVIVFLGLLWIWYLIFCSLGLYGSKRLVSRRAEALDTMKATTLAALVLGIASYVMHFRMVTPGFLVLFWGFSTFVAVSSRVAIRTYLRRLRVRGQNLRNMLIVGSNQRAIEFARTIESKPELGYRIIGFADDQWAGVEELKNLGRPLLCNLENLGSFLRRSVVDEVAIAIPLRSFHDHASDIAAMCHQQGIIIRVLSDLFNLKSLNPSAEDFEDSHLIAKFGGIEEGWPTVIKRTLDFLLSLTLLILLAPLLLIAAILIKLTSPGPVFFAQKRVGLNKRIFTIFKFRTMVVNAEQKLHELEHLNEVSGPVFKIKNDPRLTPVGRFLRKTSIDELPQLFNVLSGDMSLVGPRPLQIRDYELFTDAGEDWQRCRFSVRPGITCLWQVNGRSSLPFHQWMELDLQYVRNWSLWLDLQILARTIPAVLRGSGAA
ncbi:MAG: sugar transferase [Terriglobales bacterium]|jgi:exopolysaccharide biosynthesis polyprenyl glycosylphosphotransferase